MFDSAKKMVGQRIMQGSHVDSCKNGSALRLMLKIKLRNLVITDLQNDER